MDREKHYDVFLSHNSSDQATVEILALRLKEAGVEPWLDKWHLIPGDPWQEAIEQALDECCTCAVFLGPSGLGPWEHEEMRTALNMRVREQSFRVIPILLPGALMPERGRLPPFLSRLTWVDFRQGLDDPVAFHRLVCGIRGIVPGAAEAVTTPDDCCPFRGLEPFYEEHAEFFFGREVLTQWLVEALRDSPGTLPENRFLAVVGPSGSGKSSVVQAGLIPALRKGVLPGSEGWPILAMAPGPRPLEELAARLVPLLPDHRDPVRTLRTLVDNLAADERGLHLAVRLALSKGLPKSRLMLVVDQFEEVFTLCYNDLERRQFLDNLLYASAIASGHTVVILTMRADFYSHCLAYPDLAARLENGQVAITPMSEEELRQAIEEPALLVGLELETGLVDTILDDVASEPGALPLLQHALLELWERRQGRWLTSEAYRNIGGVQGAIARRAEQVYNGFTPAEQEIVRRIMLRLTQLGEGTEPTRRRVRTSELLPAGRESEAVEGVLKALADARLVTTTHDETSGERLVDVAHEALIRGWPRLQAWLDEDRAALLVHRRLTEAAQEWERLKREGGVLYRGARLEEALKWAESYVREMNQLEQEFLKASEALRQQEQEKAAELERAYQELKHAQERLVASERLAALGTATAALQHRISNTLNLVNPGIMRLRRRIDPDDKDAAETLDIMERNVGYTSQIISRLQEPLKEEVPTITDVNSRLKEIVQDVKEREPEICQKVTFNLDDLSPGIPRIEIGTGQLTEVLRNLVENACKAMQPQGGTLTLSSRLVNRTIEVEFQDTGPGIPPNILERLFVRPVPPKDFGAGTGLGLWLSKLILQKYGGDIEVKETRPGWGTTMLIRLPATQQSTTQQAEGEDVRRNLP